MPDDTIIHCDLPYVPNGHPRQQLDLYLPPSEMPTPLLIWVHGGAWREGDKRGRLPLEYLAAGYALASVNYRLSQHGRFPAQLEDCKAAVRWLRARATTFNIDPNRFGAWGESAGGHLVALLGTTGAVAAFEVGEHLDRSSRVQAVADYFGPTDFLQMDDHRLPSAMIHSPADSPESRLVGGAIQEHADRVAQANPITYVANDAAPFLIVHGDQDPIVPHHQSELLAAALTQAGVPVSLHTVTGGGHGNFSDSNLPELTRAFFAQYLQPE